MKLHEHCHTMVIYMQYKSKKKGKDQDSIQSSTTPNPGYKWESDFTIRHHKREPSFIKFISLLGIAEDGKTDGITVGMVDGQRQTYIWGVSKGRHNNTQRFKFYLFLLCFDGVFYI